MPSEMRRRMRAPAATARPSGCVRRDPHELVDDDDGGGSGATP
jgi:hypothetical protein